MKLIWLTCCLCVLSISCKRNVCCGLADELKEMVRIQTHCADAWGYGANDDESIVKLKRYLLQKNIITYKIELQPTGEGITCYGCTCSRGFTFHVWVCSQYINGLSAEGFTIK